MISSRTTKGDILLAVLAVSGALLLAAILLFGRSDGDILRITYDGGELEYALGTDRTFSLSSGGLELEIEVKGGEVRITSSDCGDKTCVRTGAVSRSGETIICAPARLAITIVEKTSGGGGKADADAYAG